MIKVAIRQRFLCSTALTLIDFPDQCVSAFIAMPQLIAVQQFVDQCQVAILENEMAADLVRGLEKSADSLAKAFPRLSAADRILARMAIARVVHAAVVRQGLSADGELALSLAATVIAGNSSDDSYRSLFQSWTRVLTVRAVKSPSAHRRVGRAITFIRRGYRSRAVSLSRTARAVDLSPWYLTRLLRRHTGLTFRDHLRLARVGAACRMLTTTRWSIKAIAFTVGYATTSELDRDFARVHRQSPTAYRRSRLI